MIIPSHDEGLIIYDNLIETINTLNSFNIDYEVIIVNDGSTDDTVIEVTKAQRISNRIKLISYEENKGKGRAILEGFKHVTGNLVALMDADLEIHPRQIKDFINLMKSSRVDVVLGSKRHPRSILEYPWHRKVLSWCYYVINRVLFNLKIKDTQAGLKLYRKEVLNRILPKIVVKGFAFDLEILAIANKLGYRIIEAPIKLTYSRGFGRIGLKQIIQILFDTLGIAYRLRITHYYDKGADDK